MLREIDIKEISDGKLYDSNDMVKADCGGCAGCSACCRGMGESVVLDPFDVFRMTTGLSVTFEELLKEKLDLRVVDGLILPYMQMTGKDEACVFLNEEGRCGIHAFRPGVCRLFPLGRIYEEDGFHYFLQVGECVNPNRTKVKVKKWMDTPEPKRYEQYIKDWHFQLKGLREMLDENGDWEQRRQISLFLLQTFFIQPYQKERDFYGQFEERKESFKSFIIS